MISVITRQTGKDPILKSMFTYVGHSSDKNIFNDVEDLVSIICKLECACIKNTSMILRFN